MTRENSNRLNFSNLSDETEKDEEKVTPPLYSPSWDHARVDRDRLSMKAEKEVENRKAKGKGTIYASNVKNYTSQMDLV